MSYVRTIWRTAETPLSADNMNNIEDGIEEALGIVNTIIDYVFPPGMAIEVYKTPDEFNPNVFWPETTWVLEEEGYVHVSAGDNYPLGVAGGNIVKSYTPSGTVLKHVLTANESGNQAQGITSQGQSQSHYHGTGNGTLYDFIVQNTSKMSRRNVGSSGKGYQWTTDSTNNYDAVGVRASTGYASHDHTHDVNVAAKNAIEGHDHGFTGNAAEINVMQPYIPYYKWRRTD